MTRYLNYRNSNATAYKNIREVLAPELRNLRDSDIEALLAQGNYSAEDLEDYMEFLGGLGKTFSSVARSVGGALNTAGQAVVKAAPQVLQGVVQGASQGMTLGPKGALLSGIAGGIGGAVSAATSGGQRPGGGVPSSLPIPGLGVGGGSLPIPGLGGGGSPLAGLAGGSGLQIPGLGGSPAAGQLLSLLGRPEVLQALMSMTMGPAGRRKVSVGRTSVPVGAFDNLLQTLSRRAAQEYNAVSAPGSGSTGEAYLLNYAGEIQIDPANTEQRADFLLELLQETAADYEREAAEFIERYFESDESGDESYYEDYETLELEGTYSARHYR